MSLDIRYFLFDIYLPVLCGGFDIHCLRNWNFGFYLIFGFCHLSFFRHSFQITNYMQSIVWTIPQGGMV